MYQAPQRFPRFLGRTVFDRLFRRLASTTVDLWGLHIAWEEVKSLGLLVIPLGRAGRVVLECAPERATRRVRRLSKSTWIREMLNQSQSVSSPTLLESNAYDEVKLISFLENVTPADFTSVVVRVPGAQERIPQNASHLERVGSFVSYVRAANGPGFDKLISTLKEYFGESMCAVFSTGGQTSNIPKTYMGVKIVLDLSTLNFEEMRQILDWIRDNGGGQVVLTRVAIGSTVLFLEGTAEDIEHLVRYLNSLSTGFRLTLKQPDGRSRSVALLSYEVLDPTSTESRGEDSLPKAGTTEVQGNENSGTPPAEEAVTEPKMPNPDLETAQANRNAKSTPKAKLPPVPLPDEFLQVVRFHKKHWWLSLLPVGLFLLFLITGALLRITFYPSDARLGMDEPPTTTDNSGLAGRNVEQSNQISNGQSLAATGATPDFPPKRGGTAGARPGETPPSSPPQLTSQQALDSPPDGSEFLFTPGHLQHMDLLVNKLRPETLVGPVVTDIRENLSDETVAELAASSHDKRPLIEQARLRRLLVRDLNRMLPRRTLLARFQTDSASESETKITLTKRLQSQWFFPSDFRRDHFPDLHAQVVTAILPVPSVAPTGTVPLVKPPAAKKETKDNKPPARAILPAFLKGLRPSTIVLLRSATAAPTVANPDDPASVAAIAAARTALADDFNMLLVSPPPSIAAKTPLDVHKALDNEEYRQPDANRLLYTLADRSVPMVDWNRTEIMWFNRAFIAEALGSQGISASLAPGLPEFAEPAVVTVPSSVLSERYAARTIWLAFTGLHSVLCFGAILGGFWFVQDVLRKKRGVPHAHLFHITDFCEGDAIAEAFRRLKTAQTPEMKRLREGLVYFDRGKLAWLSSGDTASNPESEDLVRALNKYLVDCCWKGPLPPVAKWMFLQWRSIPWKREMEWRIDSGDIHTAWQYLRSVEVLGPNIVLERPKNILKQRAYLLEELRRENLIRKLLALSILFAAAIALLFVFLVNDVVFDRLIHVTVELQDRYVALGLQWSDLLSILALLFLVAGATVLLLPPSFSTLANWHQNAGSMLVQLAKSVPMGANSSLDPEVILCDEAALYYAVTMRNLRGLLYTCTALLVSGVTAAQASYNWPLAYIPGIHDSTKNPFYLQYKLFLGTLVTSRAVHYSVLLIIVFIPAYIVLRHLACLLADQACREAVTVSNATNTPPASAPGAPPDAPPGKPTAPPLVDPTGGANTQGAGALAGSGATFSNTMASREQWMSARDLSGTGTPMLRYLPQLAAILAPLLAAPLGSLLGDAFRQLSQIH